MFALSAPYVMTHKEWAARSPRRSAEAAARRYARANMMAVIMRCDDSAECFAYDVANDRVAKWTERKVRWSA